jgi:predicted transcriptional regulator of viral defense system
VLDCGYAMKRTYAAQVLKRMTGKGLVQKVAHGRYRIVRTHPELVALRLAALEAELGNIS